jgi:hypothetical protein
VSPLAPTEVNTSYNPPPMTPRRWLIVLGLALVGAGMFFSVGPPDLVLLNTSLRLQYPWSRGGGALVAVAGLLVFAGTMTKLAVRLLCGVLGIGALLVSLHLLRYQLEATDAGLVSRGVLDSTAIGWNEVRKVERIGDSILITGPGEASITVDTTDFEPEQRASLERAISRRVRETAGRPEAPAAAKNP